MLRMHQTSRLFSPNSYQTTYDCHVSRSNCEHVTMVKSRPDHCHIDLFSFFHSECEVYSKNHAAPFSKVITFRKKESFDLHAFYSTAQDLPYPDTAIGRICDEAKCKCRIFLSYTKLVEIHPKNILMMYLS